MTKLTLAEKIDHARKRLEMAQEARAEARRSQASTLVLTLYQREVMRHQRTLMKLAKEAES